MVTAVHLLKLDQKKKKASKNTKPLPACTVIFVVGAPGTGKGTQCELLLERTKTASGAATWVHLSAGDLLRAERKRVTDANTSKNDNDPDPDLELAHTIQDCINAGQLVPSSITVQLLEKGMQAAYSKTGVTQFLLDGFPRGQDNIDAWDERMAVQNVTVKGVLNYDCPEEVLVGRLLERGKSSGRSDDNMETIRKRFQTHVEACQPVLERYTKDNIMYNINADRSKEEVYKQTDAIVKGLL